MKPETIHIGIDVSKEHLDVYDPVSGRSGRLPNTLQGFRAIRDMARRLKAIVCCEPTGGLELDLVLFLQPPTSPWPAATHSAFGTTRSRPASFRRTIRRMPA